MWASGVRRLWRLGEPVRVGGRLCDHLPPPEPGPEAGDCHHLPCQVIKQFFLVLVVLLTHKAYSFALAIEEGFVYRREGKGRRSFFGDGIFIQFLSIFHEDDFKNRLFCTRTSWRIRCKSEKTITARACDHLHELYLPIWPRLNWWPCVCVQRGEE